jgi:HEAT repeat protein
MNQKSELPAPRFMHHELRKPGVIHLIHRGFLLTERRFFCIIGYSRTIICNGLWLLRLRTTATIIAGKAPKGDFLRIVTSELVLVGRQRVFGDISMSNRKTIPAVLAAILFLFSAAFAQTLEGNWNDFLHFTEIGRFDLAKGYAQAILDSNPEPVELLSLSEANRRGYTLLQRVIDTAPDPEQVELSKKVLNIIDEGLFIRRADPKIIVEEVKRLSTTTRGWHIAVKRLQNAGEYAIPFMLDAIADRSRENEWPAIKRALPHIGRDAIRPLAAALQTDNLAVKTEIVKALGEIKYPQAMPYLKHIIEKEDSLDLRGTAKQSVRQIDPAALRISAAQLFLELAQNYYYHAESLAPAEDAPFANIWFWDPEAKRLTRERVDKGYFNELMSMRVCEWALKADPEFGKAIGLWLAAYFKAEAANVDMPNYFGQRHAKPFVYATTAGPEYLHQALTRGIKDKNAYVALGAVEALAVTAGEKSLLYRLGASQPLVQALSFNDKAVKYSAAIAIAEAGPKQAFPESKLVVQNLAEALGQDEAPSRVDSNVWNPELADSYAVRAASAMLSLADTRNRVIDLSYGKNALMSATNDKRPDVQILSGQVLAYLRNPDAQRSIAAMALADTNTMFVRVRAFNSLAVSAKLFGSLLDDNMVDAIYSLVGSTDIDDGLRSAAATAFGALNLPSEKVKDLILDQAKS